MHVYGSRLESFKTEQEDCTENGPNRRNVALKTEVMMLIQHSIKNMFFPKMFVL